MLVRFWGTRGSLADAVSMKADWGHSSNVAAVDPLPQRLQPLRYLHDCSDCFRLEQNRRVGFVPTEKRRLCTAHANS